jgi:hypothetical protein
MNRRIKSALGILALAFCLNAQPIVAGLSTASDGPAAVSQVIEVGDVQPAYSTILTQGRGFWESLAINAALAAGALVIGVATGGAGAVAATAAGVV